MRLLIFCCAIALSFSCQNGDKKSATKSNKTASTKTVSDSLPSLPLERMMSLYKNATGMDYVFLELPVSINMPNQQAIQSHMVHFDAIGIRLNPDCKQHDGNIIFSINGDIVEECYFFYRNSCKYFVWLENGKPKYGNRLTAAGDAFFKEVFSGDIMKRAN